MMEQNKQLAREVDTYKKRLEVKDREQDLLKRQIRSVEEDLERRNEEDDLV